MKKPLGAGAIGRAIDIVDDRGRLYCGFVWDCPRDTSSVLPDVAYLVMQEPPNKGRPFNAWKDGRDPCDPIVHSIYEGWKRALFPKSRRLSMLAGSQYNFVESTDLPLERSSGRLDEGAVGMVLDLWTGFEWYRGFVDGIQNADDGSQEALLTVAEPSERLRKVRNSFGGLVFWRLSVPSSSGVMYCLRSPTEVCAGLESKIV